eukprot:COSAG04_NODE_8703_length_941_cov_1.161520_2_plen_198_part_00
MLPPSCSLPTLSAAPGADFVASDTGEAVTGYGDTDPHTWDGVDLPKPTTDIDRMRADMADWGFCLVEEAVSAEQLAALRKRFDDQIAGEFAAGIGKAQFPQQTGFNCAVNKGELFRQCVTLDEAAIQKGGIIEQLMTEILGPGWILNNLVGNACGKDLQPQALHCGQSMVPKPWPDWPFECFFGFLLDDFSKETGGT